LNFSLGICYDEIVRFIKSLLIFLVLFFVNIGAANASINVTHEPNPIYSNTNQIKFIFTSDQKDFILDKEYMLNLSFKAQRDNNIIIKPRSENLLEIVTNGTGLRPGEFTYALCIREWFFASCPNNETKVVSGKFTVFKTDDPPAIAMEHYNFRAGSTAPVYILNAKPNIDYRFWFDGELTTLGTNNVWRRNACLGCPGFEGYYNEDEKPPPYN